MAKSAPDLLDQSPVTRFGPPRESGDPSLERCIRKRRSVRGFCDEPLALDDLGQLLWAAQGITGEDGQRSAASAGALYPLELIVAVGRVAGLLPGVFRYQPAQHEIVQVARGNPAEQALEAVYGREWIATAPAIICIAAVFARTTAKYNERGIRYVYMEAGHAAQNVMLQAVRIGLATTIVGAFDDGSVAQIFHLEPDETPLCLLPVGGPRE